MEDYNSYFEKLNVSEEEINQFIKERFDPDIKIKRAEELLNEKYGLNFEITQYCGHFESFEAYKVFAYEKEHPDITFEAVIGDEEDYVEDSYASKYICKRIADYLEEQIEYNDSYYHFYVESMPVIMATKDYKIDFERLAKVFPKNKYCIFLFLVSKDGEKRQVSDDIINKLINTVPQFSGFFSLYSISEEKEAEVLRYLTTRARIYADFTIEHQDELVYRKKFSDGILI